MRSRSIEPLRALVLICFFIFVVWQLLDCWVTWTLTREWIFSLNNRDYFTGALWISPTVIGHLATLWGHYFRSEREFQHGISKVTAPKSEKQKMSLWEHHILWGYTVKYWMLVAIILLLKFSWVVSVTVPSGSELFTDYEIVGGLGLTLGFIGGYSAIGSCTMILFLVLRRGMLHSLGFTYAEILPLHRWLGVAIVFWSLLHTCGYTMYYVWDHSFTKEFNFDDVGRSTMNLMGFVALFALLFLALLSLPQIRRRFYTAFMTVHRIMTVIFLIGTIVHYPYYMLWYYLLPSIILFLVDRFVPKMVQARTLYPEASITLNADADIVRMTFTSPEPMKPYYPGDYIMVQVPELGTLYHPFTIASYWPEDPRSITLFIRTYHDNKRSWTGAMSRLCGSQDKRIRVKANVDGVFGDRRHDYLKSDVVVVFVAGAAITTFMSLIKAIAAQITSSDNPLRLQFYLICTFRTRSELHAYGSFLHQITRDTRFTSWLHVEIYVSRPDKPKTLMGAHAHVVKNDIMVPGQSVSKKQKTKKRFQSLRRTGTKLKRALSGRTVVGVPATIEETLEKAQVSSGADDKMHKHSESTGTVVDIKQKEHDNAQHVSSSSSSSSVHSYENHTTCPTPVTATSPSSPVSTRFGDTIHAEVEKAPSHDTDHNNTDLRPSYPTRAMTYDAKRLPTFHDAQSSSVATRFAKLDLMTTALLIFIPLGVWYGMRAVKWEGAEHYCDIMAEMTPTQDKICYGIYSTAPIFIHYGLTSLMGYFAVWLARNTLLKSLNASNLKDIETGKAHNSNLPYPDFEMEDEKLSVEDGNWDEGDVVYSVGRMNVKIVVDRFIDAGVGVKDTTKASQKLVTVFGGGPEAFVEHVERQIKKAKWVVDFHRETWAP